MPSHPSYNSVPVGGGKPSKKSVDSLRSSRKALAKNVHVTKKVRRLAQTKLKLNKLRKGNSVDYYYDKAKKKIDLKKVKANAAIIPLNLLYELDRIAPKQSVVLNTLFEKHSSVSKKIVFTPTNGTQERYIGLADVYRQKPQIRAVRVNGKLAIRRGYAGPFFYVLTKSDGKAVRPIRLKGYAAILSGYSVEPVKSCSLAMLKTLSARYAVTKPVVIKKVYDVVRKSLKAIYQIKDAKVATKMVLSVARNEGVSVVALIEILKSKTYPSGGIQHLTGHVPFPVLLRWTARMTRINEEKFKAMSNEKSRKGKRYTEAFLKYNVSGKFPKSVRMKKDYRKLWKSPLSGRGFNLRRSIILGNLTPAQIQRIRANEKHISPERLRQIKKRLFEIERYHLKNGGKPGFVNGRKDLNSEYNRLLRELRTPPTETLESSDTFKRRLKFIDKAIKLYKLPPRFRAIILATMRYESNYGQVMVNQGVSNSGASGLGQFIWSTWKKFLHSMDSSPQKEYFEKARKQGYLPIRGDEYFMIHAMAWHFRRTVNAMKSRMGLTEQQATNQDVKWYYVHYHDGDAGALALRQYLAHGRDPAYLRYSFQKNYRGSYDPHGRSRWLLGYATKVQRLANGRWKRYMGSGSV